MRRFLVPGIATILVVAFLAVLAFGVSSQGTNSSIENQVARGRDPLAPELNTALPVLGSSRRESLADLRGKVVLLNAFASWCVPCVQEAPVLERAEHILARHDGTVLGVSFQDNTQDTQTFVRQHHLTYPVIRDVTGDFVHSFGTSGIPDSFLISRDGRVEALQLYQLNNQWVDQTLKKALAQPA